MHKWQRLDEVTVVTATVLLVAVSSCSQTSGRDVKSIYFDFISSSQLDGKSLYKLIFCLQGS